MFHRLIHAIETLNERLHQMSASRDNLTAAVTSLETAATAVVAEVASLQAGSDNAALDALTGRVTAVTNSLTAAVPPPPAP